MITNFFVEVLEDDICIKRAYQSCAQLPHIYTNKIPNTNIFIGDNAKTLIYTCKNTAQLRVFSLFYSNFAENNVHKHNKDE